VRRSSALSIDSPRQWGVLVVLAIVLPFLWATHITGDIIKEDAGENLRMALSLQRAGVMSNNAQPPFRPSMVREPIPVISTCLTLNVIDAMIGRADAADYFQGQRARLVKCQNVVWLGCLCIAVFVFIRRLTPSFACAVAGVLLLNLIVFADSQPRMYMLDSLYTEAPAAFFLAVISLALASALRSRKASLMAFAGICCGIMALTKAAFLYVTAGIVIILPFAALMDRREFPVKVLLRDAAIVAVTCFAVAGPWMYRNYTALGTFGITMRGGEAIYFRALLDGLSGREYVESFAVWAPYPLNGLLRRALGVSREDIENGVRFQHLNDSPLAKWWAADLAAENAGRPQDTFSIHRLTGAEREKLIREFTGAGNPDPELAADHVLGRRGVQMILAHPFKHLANVVPELWRATFFSFPLLVIALAYACRRRDPVLAVMFLPALGLVAFYALLAPFYPRYALPVMPIAACIAAVIGDRLYKHFLARRPAGQQSVGLTRPD
jgi:hypothetical protein